MSELEGWYEETVTERDDRKATMNKLDVVYSKNETILPRRHVRFKIKIVTYVIPRNPTGCWYSARELLEMRTASGQ